MRNHLNTTRPTWIQIGHFSEFHEGKKVKKLVKGQEVFILNQNSRLFAFEAKCPHVGQTLELATCDNYRLTCNWHGIVFDLDDDGKIIKDSGFIGIPKIKMYQLKIENGVVFIAS